MITLQHNPVSQSRQSLDLASELTWVSSWKDVDEKNEIAEVGRVRDALVVDTSLEYDLGHDFLDSVAGIWFGCGLILRGSFPGMMEGLPEVCSA